MDVLGRASLLVAGLMMLCATAAADEIVPSWWTWMRFDQSFAISSRKIPARRSVGFHLD